MTHEVGLPDIKLSSNVVEGLEKLGYKQELSRVSPTTYGARSLSSYLLRRRSREDYSI